MRVDQAERVENMCGDWLDLLSARCFRQWTSAESLMMAHQAELRKILITP